MFYLFYFWYAVLFSFGAVYLFIHSVVSVIIDAKKKQPAKVGQNAFVAMLMAMSICVSFDSLYCLNGELWPSLYEVLMNLFSAWFPNLGVGAAWYWGTFCVIAGLFSIIIALALVLNYQELKIPVKFKQVFCGFTNHWFERQSSELE